MLNKTKTKNLYKSLDVQQARNNIVLCQLYIIVQGNKLRADQVTTGMP